MLKYIIILSFFSLNLLAQSVDDLSNAEIQNFMKQAQASGMSEDQLIAAAAAKGYTASDIAKFKGKVAAMQTNKNTGGDTETKVSRSVDSTDIAKNQKIERKIDPKQEAARAKIFGLNIFNNQSLNFEPNLKIATPKNYVLGTDDELSIDISGYAFAHYIAKVSAEGNIKIENLSPIYVSGQTVEQAKEKIIQRLRTLYGGLSKSGNLTADVTLTKIRSIKINLIGEVVFPGTYTVPSLATAFNLLYAAGGPSDIGSLRNIEIHRAGKIIKTLDLYDYLLKGDLKDNVVLQDQDLIRVPYVKLTVSVNGQVRNPKTFELKKGETLQTLLDFAGGFSEYAYTNSLRLDRVTDTEKKIFTIDKVLFGSFLPQKGDLITVDLVEDNFGNKVIITGGVHRPGAYALETTKTLGKLLEKAEGLKNDAFLERILIKRERANLDPEMIQVNYKETSGKDFLLFKNDSIIVKRYTELREKRVVQVDGEVNKPQVIDFAENLTVGDVIAMSGGFKDGATASKIEIARRVKDEKGTEKSVEILQLSIAPDLTILERDRNFILQAFDRIYVRKLSNYETQKLVSIQGEVLYPGPYALQDKTERIADLIMKSGGIKSQADLGSAKFTRKGQILGLDIKKIVEQPEIVSNILLETGDILEIPRKKETVNISGNVYNPITIPFDPIFKLKDYLSLAGGTNDSSYVKKIYVKYGNGRMARTKSFMGFKSFPKIETGSEIIVPTYKKQRWSAAERIAISSAVVSIATVLLTLVLRIVP